MKQLLLVAKETYLRQVKSWAFLIMLLSPFLILGFSLGIGYITGSSVANSDKVAVVSSDSSLKESFEEVDNITVEYETEETARNALKKEKISGYIFVDVSEKTVKATYYSDASLSRNIKEQLHQVLDGLQSQLNMAQASLTSEQMKTLAQQYDFEEKITEKGDLKKAGKYETFFGLTFIMYFIILTYAASTAQDIASEKGTKIMEVIFSSIPANLYFYGRILGILGVITTHLGLYSIGGFLAYHLIPFSQGVASFKPMLDTVIDNLDWNMLFFAIFGILIYVILAALCGSLVVRVEDVNKAVQPVIYLVVIGFSGAITLGQQGKDNIILEVGSYIPFISSFFMPIRLIHGYAGILEAMLSLTILIITAVLGTLFIGKSYSGLILQTDDIGLFKSLKRGWNYK